MDLWQQFKRTLSLWGEQPEFIFTSFNLSEPCLGRTLYTSRLLRGANFAYEFLLPGCN